MKNHSYDMACTLYFAGDYVVTLCYCAVCFSLCEPGSKHAAHRHPLMVRLHRTKSADPNLAQMIAEQVFDNSLVAAGLMDDSRVMLPR